MRVKELSLTTKRLVTLEQFKEIADRVLTGPTPAER
jgi:hypothetical protein